MRKIPTVFVRDHESNQRYVSREPHPDCGWVFVGEGVPTRKYDGTCVRFDGRFWWARREVKPGKTAPANFVHVDHDETTGKTIGWEPVEQSAFAKYHAEAVAYQNGTGISGWPSGTYELVGPKVNGNPEGVNQHQLWAHAAAEILDLSEDGPGPYGVDEIEHMVHWAAERGWEGIVWHHPDGRMAKLKRKDFPS